MRRFRLAIGAATMLLGGCALPAGIPSWDYVQAAIDAANDPASLSDTGVIAGEPLVLDASDGEPVIEATINGLPVRLRVETAHSGITLNPEAAARIGLAPSLYATNMRIGPVIVPGQTAMANIATGPGISRQRVTWYDRPVTEGADGIVTIADLPYPRVTLTLAPATGSEVPIVLSTVPRQYSVVHRHDAGPRRIDIRMMLASERTFVTTAAGALLAQTNGGSWAGEKGRHVISMGVARGVREMDFARPLDIRGLRLDSALIRLADYQSDTDLPLDPVEDDDDTILVAGRHERSDAAWFVTLGRDALVGCSSLTYEKATRNLTLMCATDR